MVVLRSSTHEAAFTPEPATGGGCFTVPLDLPPGPGGSAPALALRYAIGALAIAAPMGEPVTADAVDYASVFADERRFVWGVCYRMTGNAADATANGTCTSGSVKLP